MRGRQPFSRLNERRDDRSHRVPAAEPACERRAAHELHRDHHASVERLRLVHRDDIGMAELRERTALGEQAIGADRIGHRDHLERDVTTSSRGSRASYTTPMPPAPRRDTISNRPIRVAFGLHADQPLAHAGAHGGGVEIVVSRPDPREHVRDGVVLEAHGPIVPGRTIFGITLPRAPISRSCIPTVRFLVSGPRGRAGLRQEIRRDKVPPPAAKTAGGGPAAPAVPKLASTVKLAVDPTEFDSKPSLDFFGPAVIHANKTKRR